MFSASTIGHPQLQQLQCQIEISLNIGGVHDIDDAVGLSLQNKVPGHDLLLGVGAQGVDTRQIDHLSRSCRRLISPIF